MCHFPMGGGGLNQQPRRVDGQSFFFPCNDSMLSFTLSLAIIHSFIYSCMQARSTYGGPNTSQGLLWWLSGKESAYQWRRHRFDPRVGKNPLEEEMATHSSILAWEIPRTDDPGGHSPWCHKRVRHKLATKTTTHPRHNGGLREGFLSWNPY